MRCFRSEVLQLLPNKNLEHVWMIQHNVTAAQCADAGRAAGGEGEGGGERGHRQVTPPVPCMSSQIQWKLNLRRFPPLPPAALLLR